MAKVGIFCEESQTVCKAFRERGHEAYSIDLLPCSGGKPEWHIQGFAEDVIGSGSEWDLIIAFPPCTHLAVSGARHFAAKRLDGRQQQAVHFFMMFTARDCARICIENPVGIMSTEYRKPDQIVQPYYFGDPFTKTTCLWLKGLPKLVPTNIVDKGERTYFKSGKNHPKWYADALKLSPKERERARSKTFPGLAQAMASQWSNLLNPSL